ncbi:MAG: hypothetical protein ABI675_02980 [Chitinophagaceae bacterium]
MRTRGFIPGTYVCIDSVTTKQLEIKRLSALGEVYEMILQDGKDEKKWHGYFDNRMLLLTSHDYDKSIAFLPEEGKLTYDGLLYAKTLL